MERRAKTEESELAGKGKSGSDITAGINQAPTPEQPFPLLIDVASLPVFDRWKPEISEVVVAGLAGELEAARLRNVIQATPKLDANGAEELAFSLGYYAEARLDQKKLTVSVKPAPTIASATIVGNALLPSKQIQEMISVGQDQVYNFDFVDLLNKEIERFFLDIPGFLPRVRTSRFPVSEPGSVGVIVSVGFNLGAEIPLSEKSRRREVAFRLHEVTRAERQPEIRLKRHPGYGLINQYKDEFRGNIEYKPTDFENIFANIGVPLQLRSIVSHVVSAAVAHPNSSPEEFLKDVGFANISTPAGARLNMREEPTTFAPPPDPAISGRSWPTTFEEAKAWNPKLRPWSEMRKERGAGGRRISIWDHLRNPETGLGLWTRVEPGLPRIALREIDGPAGQLVDRMAKDIPPDIHLFAAPKGRKPISNAPVSEEVVRRLAREAARARRAAERHHGK